MVWWEDVFCLYEEILSFLETDIINKWQSAGRSDPRASDGYQKHICLTKIAKGFANGGHILGVFWYDAIHREK